MVPEHFARLVTKTARGVPVSEHREGFIPPNQFRQGPGGDTLVAAAPTHSLEPQRPARAPLRRHDTPPGRSEFENTIRMRRAHDEGPDVENLTVGRKLLGKTPESVALGLDLDPMKDVRHDGDVETDRAAKEPEFFDDAAAP